MLFQKHNLAMQITVTELLLTLLTCSFLITTTLGFKKMKRNEEIIIREVINLPSF